MKVSDPLPLQKDALRYATVSMGATRTLPGCNIDLFIELGEQRKVLALVAREFLAAEELAVITRILNLDGEGYASRRYVAEELGMSLETVLKHERGAIESIKQNFSRVLGRYERQAYIARHNIHRCTLDS